MGMSASRYLTFKEIPQQYLVQKMCYGLRFCTVYAHKFNDVKQQLTVNVLVSLDSPLYIYKRYCVIVMCAYRAICTIKTF